MEASDRQNKRRLILRLTIPTVLIILTFTISFYVIFIPTFQSNLVDKKKETIRELSYTAWSILDNLNHEFESGHLTISEAQREALAILQKTRYGNENKDYFWVTDLEPKMLIHPYRPDLNGQNLQSFQDPNGKRLFIEAVELVRQEEEGYLDYMWQWKDDSTRIVPKLSFVKIFSPWGWVIGTGIYLEDVRQEISAVKSTLTLVSLSIILLASLLLLYILRQNLLTEKLRKQAEDQLRESREKYRSLVNAATEGSFMVLDNQLAFYNPYMASLLGYNQSELYQYSIEDLFPVDDPEEIGLNHWQEFLKNDEPSARFTVSWSHKNGQLLNLVVQLSKIDFGEQSGYLGMVRPLTVRDQQDLNSEKLSEDIEAAMLLMNLPVTHLMRAPLSCQSQLPASEAASLMTANQEPVILIRGASNEYLGLVTDRDLRERVIAAGKDPDQPVHQFMTSPLLEISDEALLYEAQLLMLNKKMSHLVVKDGIGKIVGLLSQADLSKLSATSNSLILQDIDQASTISQLIERTGKSNAMVNAMIDTGAKVSYISKFISGTADRVSNRIIQMAFDQFGQAPVPFAFIALGSEGREEQSLLTDQDNAIIYSDEGMDDPGVEEYFTTLANFLNTSIDSAGYQFCKGGVMAMNDRWRQPLQVWKNYFTKWIKEADPQNLLDINSFFDIRLIYGDENLLEELRQYIVNELKNKTMFQYHLAQQVLHFKAPLTVLSNLQFDKPNLSGDKSIDLKQCLMPIILFARIYAWQNGITDPSTQSRLKQLLSMGVIADDLYDKALQAFEFLTRLRLKHQLHSLTVHGVADNLLGESELSEIETGMLKKVLTYTEELRTKIKLDFPPV